LPITFYLPTSTFSSPVISHDLIENRLKGEQVKRTVDMDVRIAGAIPADMGKLLEYVLGENGKSVQGSWTDTCAIPFQGYARQKAAGFPPGGYHITRAMREKGAW
jgi:hypothetical protein